MSPRTTPPFRADPVGSLLRPPELLQAREDFKERRIDADELRAIEDEAIRDVVRKQEEVGLQSATDGEFRRASWHMDFIYQLGGINHAADHLTVQFRNAEGTIEFTPAALHVEDRVALREPIFVDAFRFVQECATTATPKLTIPSPSMVHYRGGRAAVNEDVYPDMDEFWSDLTTAYTDELKALGDLGCTYLQFDDTSLAYLTTPSSARTSPSWAGTPSTSTRPTSATSVAATSAPRGWPRAATTSWPRRSSTTSTSTASSWSGTTRARAASSPCASCRRASTSSSASSPPSAAS
jgi:5-methyltetrahydropteroyltriglutamate--homocysteine methyltransferase